MSHATIYARKLAMFEEAIGGVIRQALEDPGTTEVMCNPDNRLWQERHGQPMVCIGSLTLGEADRIIRLAASLDETVIDTERPSVDATLPGGQRFHGSIPPRVKAPYFTI